MTTRDRRVHRAVAGFDRTARLYERGRPDYPAEAVRWLGRGLGLGPHRTVVELGSGTGKFTRCLLPLGATIVPVEPTPGMRAEFTRALPDLPVLDGTAEAIPVPDGFADAVVGAQAFHWFRLRPTVAEIQRVLRPRGAVGMVWNRRDESLAWVAELSRILEPHRKDAPSHADAAWEHALENRAYGFGPLHHRTFRHVQHLDRRTLLARVQSVSLIAILPPAQRRAVSRAVRELVDRDPTTRGRQTLLLPYRTDVYWARRR